MLALYEATQWTVYALRISARLLPASVVARRTWIGAYEHHLFQMALALILIAVLGRRKFSEWGLNLRNRSLSLRILARFCIVYIPVILAVNVVPVLIMRARPSFGYPVDAVNVAGWLSFTWLFVGFSEEIVFRGLIHTYLAKAWTGVWKIGSVSLPYAGIIASVIFSLAHISPIHPHIYWSQLLWALGLGLFYSAVYYRTGSLLAPILAHNFSDGLMFSAQYAVYGLLR
jgi:membrane protease YdiL (CAAX protease family)